MTRAGALYRAGRALRGLAPFASILLLVFIGALPFPVPGLSPVMPALTVIAVYYWSIYRPDLLPLVATFFIGLVQDAIQGTPLGMSALVLLLVQGTVVSQRRFFRGKTFLVEWWGFMLVAPVAALIGWLLISAHAGTIVVPRPLGVRLVLTFAAYPCLSWLLGRFQHRLLRGT